VERGEEAWWMQEVVFRQMIIFASTLAVTSTPSLIVELRAGREWKTW